MTKYVLDTSVFIEFAKRAPTAWKDEKIENTLKKNILNETYIIIEHVSDELYQKKGESGHYIDFKKWLEPFKSKMIRKNIYINAQNYEPDSAYQKVMKAYEFFLVNPKDSEIKNNTFFDEFADPNIIIYALQEGYSVISNELFSKQKQPSVKQIRKVKIPNVCKHLGVPHMSLEDFIYTVTKESYNKALIASNSPINLI